MNKKGFTLVELLAIVVLIGVIAAVAVPNITKEINNNEKEQENQLNKKIENASKLYAAKYHADKLINDSRTGDIIFYLSDLEDDGVLSLSKDECTDKDTKTKKTAKILINVAAEYNYEDLKNLGNCYTK